MINFYFKTTTSGYAVFTEKGNRMYDCKNRMKGAALDEARSFCSSFDTSHIHDCTYRMLSRFKWVTSGDRMDVAIKELEALHPGVDVRVRRDGYELDRIRYEVELWGQ